MRRIALPEGTLLSSHRDYLRVTRGKYTFDLCAAPFGIDFFVSWWLVEQPAAFPAASQGGSVIRWILLAHAGLRSRFWHRRRVGVHEWISAFCTLG